MAELKYANKLISNIPFPIMGITGVSMSLKHKRSTIHRTMCSCGYVSSRWDSHCPNCGGEIYYVNHDSFAFILSNDTGNGVKTYIWTGKITYSPGEEVFLESEFYPYFSVTKTDIILHTPEILEKSILEFRSLKCVDMHDNTAMAIQKYVDNFYLFLRKIPIYEDGYIFYYVAKLMRLHPHIYKLSILNKKTPNGEFYSQVFSNMFHTMWFDRPKDWDVEIEESDQKTMKTRFRF